MKRLLWFGLLWGCVSDPQLTDAPCPCLADQVCCELTNRCVATATECPALPDARVIIVQADRGPQDAGPDRAPASDAFIERDAAPGADAGPANVTVTVEPALGPHTGGTEIAVQVDPPFEIARVMLAGRPCALIESTPRQAICVTPASDLVVSRADVLVEGTGGEVAVVPRGFHYLLPPLSDVTEATGLASAGMVSLYGESVVPVVENGRIELVLAGQLRLGLLEQIDGIRFAPRSTTWLENAPPGTRIGAFPANEDAAPDLFIPRMPGDEHGVFGSIHVRTPGEFGAAVNLPRMVLPVALVAVPLDLDGDGDLDLFGAVIPNGNPLFITLLNDELQFDPDPVDVDPARAAASPLIVDIEVVDFDRDGRLDIVACGHQMWFFRNERGAFVDQTLAMGFPQLTRVCGDIEIADVDNDGWFDVLVTSTVGDPAAEQGTRLTGVTALFNVQGQRVDSRSPHQADDTFLRCAGQRVGEALVGIGAGGLMVFDADLDGDVDLLLPHASTRCPTAMAYYRNDHVPEKVLMEGERIGPSHHPGAAGGLVMDFDGDGDLDVLSHARAVGDPSSIPRVIRGNAVDNAHPDAPVRWLGITPIMRGRVYPGTWLEVDLDGPADAPDWAPGYGRIAVRNFTDSALDGHRPDERIIGLGTAEPPYHVRVHYPDGRTLERRIDAPNQRVVIDPQNP